MQRWRAAIERIYNEIVELHSNREIWQYLNVELPKHDGAIIHESLTRWYVDSQAAAVRRIASDRSQDGASLYHLLKSINHHVPDFGGARYQVVMTGQSVQYDMDTLKQTAHIVSRWADENVAHMGRTRSVSPTFNDLDTAINSLGSVLQKYYLVLTGGYLPEVTPAIADDWKRPFREAWL